MKSRRPLDRFLLGRQFAAVNTNVRTFLRNFSTFKAMACRGVAVRIRDEDGEFLFTAVVRRRTLLGAARGKIAFHADLTKPTLP